MKRKICNEFYSPNKESVRNAKPSTSRTLYSLLSRPVNLTTRQSNQLIYDIATQRKLTNDISTPLMKLSCTNGVDMIANGYYGIEVIELCHIVFTICSSCQVFLDN